MKKIIAICLSIAMLTVFGVTASAAPGSFVNSPAGNTSLDILDYEFEDESCTAYLALTPYGQRDELDAEKLAAIEAAYGQIAATADLTSLNAALADKAADMGVDASDLAVSDLFDLSWYGCVPHNAHYPVTVTLSADMLKNFVGLLHLLDGKWQLVDNATVGADGTTLTFTVESLSPFAVVVDTDAAVEDSSSEEDVSQPEGPSSPETGDNVNLIVWGSVLAVIALGVAAVGYKKRNA